jgi:hypothetical protein
MTIGDKAEKTHLRDPTKCRPAQINTIEPGSGRVVVNVPV